MSRKKELIYDNVELISDRARGHSQNIALKNDQYFWKFNGEFWADELGDYSFGLKSNCNLIPVQQHSNLLKGKNST